MNEDLKKVIERYVNSTNADKKDDYIKMMNYIAKQELDETTRTSAEEMVINHFLDNSPKGKELFAMLSGKDKTKCNDADEIAKLYVTAQPAEREEIYNEFKKLWNGSNPETKAYLVNLERWKFRKSKIADKIRDNLRVKSMTLDDKTTELAYLQSAIEQLKTLAKTNFEDFCEQYTKIGVRLRDQLLQETLLPTKEEKVKAFTKYTDMFKAIRQQIEEENGIFDTLTNPFTCPECNVLNLFITRLQKRKEDEDIQQVFDDFLQTISYREMTQRTFPSGGLMRRFMLGATMYNLGYVDELGLYKVWSTNGYITNKELADKLPLELAEQIAQF